MSEEKERSYNILVYGIEKHGLTAPIDSITSRNYNLSFEPFNSASRFNEYDGVILFQGLFEDFEWKPNYMNSYLDHYCDNNELDKRKKEAALLIKKGGFLCFLLNSEFIDREDRRDFRNSDLAKCHLNYGNFYRENFKSRIANLDIKSDEFRAFLEIHGAATSHFRHFNEYIDWRILVKAEGRAAGFIINKNEYFIPSLIPNNRPEVIREYFGLLATGLTSSYNKLQITLPDWIDEFEFSEEKALSDEQQALEARISEIEGRRSVLRKYKSSLILSGDELAACTSEIFLHGFGIPVDTKDELREDFKVLDAEGNPVLLCEVKGTNKGVKREYVNQADSHRERSGLQDEFPTTLIVNTNIRNSRTIAEKDQDVAKEQVLHAVKMNILIIRTLDLLELLKIYLDDQLTIEQIMDLLTTNNGWLKVIGGKIDVIQNPEAD
tara:strand:- start:385 stop:1695 length:1311 start_codon:yes stop_codon:yes gene_type:complete